MLKFNTQTYWMMIMVSSQNMCYLIYVIFYIAKLFKYDIKLLMIFKIYI